MKFNFEEARTDCWNRALEAHGTYFLFERRANRYRFRLRVLSFLGLIVPVVIGGIVVSFSAYTAILPYVLPLAGILAVVQLVATVWSLTNGWTEGLGYSEGSLRQNLRLSQSFERLARNMENSDDSRVAYEVYLAEDQNLQESDEKQGLTEKERRMGMRAGLRKFRRECVACHKVPVDMTSTSCGVCGKF